LKEVPEVLLKLVPGQPPNGAASVQGHVPRVGFEEGCMEGVEEKGPVGIGQILAFGRHLSFLNTVIDPDPTVPERRRVEVKRH
jgi:hypothetical protein